MDFWNSAKQADSLVLVNVKFKTATIFKFLAYCEMIKLVKIVWVLKLGISLVLLGWNAILLQLGDVVFNVFKSHM